MNIIIANGKLKVINVCVYVVCTCPQCIEQNMAKEHKIPSQINTFSSGVSFVDIFDNKKKKNENWAGWMNKSCCYFIATKWSRRIIFLFFFSKFPSTCGLFSDSIPPNAETTEHSSSPLVNTHINQISHRHAAGDGIFAQIFIVQLNLYFIIGLHRITRN